MAMDNFINALALIQLCYQIGLGISLLICVTHSEAQVKPCFQFKIRQIKQSKFDIY